MNLLISIRNLLQFCNDNWTIIIIIIGLGVSLYKKITDYLKLTEDEKIATAKAQIQEVVLKMITDAEEDYSDWVSAGSIKRSQVIAQIFEEYPILSKVTDQETLVKWIDEQIDNALVTLREIINVNDKGAVSTGVKE